MKWENTDINSKALTNICQNVLVWLKAAPSF